MRLTEKTVSVKLNERWYKVVKETLKEAKKKGYKVVKLSDSGKYHIVSNGIHDYTIRIKPRKSK